MTDRIDPPDWPSPRGPWPEVDDITRRHDHGWSWCTNAAGHPGADGYPDAAAHVPWHECRGPEFGLDRARRDLDGEPAEVLAYLAAPFRFGQLRTGTSTEPPRIVLELAAADGQVQRVSLDQGEALRLARVLGALVDSAMLGSSAA